ncbi:hypothetical protein M5689_008623 [Euphorbia peplus]|nr:hypothetical protein M5689_008623 [Euphorbia peplus]
MAAIAICHMGGNFKTADDGTLTYEGGFSHAVDIDILSDLKFQDFKKDVAETLNTHVIWILELKYFLPGNKKTLITISNDKDLKRMMKYHEDSKIIDIYVDFF